MMVAKPLTNLCRHRESQSTTTQRTVDDARKVCPLHCYPAYKDQGVLPILICWEDRDTRSMVVLIPNVTKRLASSDGSGSVSRCAQSVCTA